MTKGTLVTLKMTIRYRDEFEVKVGTVGTIVNVLGEHLVQIQFDTVRVTENRMNVEAVSC